jgi:diguanylate cyclase (GGDEF)-like protein
MAFRHSLKKYQDNIMEPLVKDLIGKLGTPAILNTRFMQLLNSLSGIKTISNLGNQQIDKEQFIDCMMQTIIENLEVEEVSLYLLAEKSLNCVAHLNWEKFIANESSMSDENISYLLSEGVIGKTATNRQVVHIHNCKTSDENLIKYEANGRKVGSLICAPVMANNSLLGVLELSHPDPNHFESWQEHSIVIYADLMGMLLNNIKLMSDMQSIIDVRTEELRHSLEESERLRARYEEMSVIDPLTKLYNRRYFFTEVTSGLARAKRYEHPFSLLLMDLDHFKQVNDKNGHECGDRVLSKLSQILSQFTREGDTLARIGGEEFVLALPETASEGAVKLAERIRATVENHEWECKGNTMNITLSIGLASLLDCNDDEIHEDDIQVSDILRKADLALYYVKHNGRNNVKSFSEIP